MSSWNSVVFVKSSRPIANPSEVTKLLGIEEVWSTSGDWDWCIKLDAAHSSPEQTEVFVSKLRATEWVAETKTNWWKKVVWN